MQISNSSKRFLNLSSQESKLLDIHIFRNALKLNRDAITIAKNNKSYSTATSLLILSTEELIKAILVLLHSEDYKVYLIPDANKFFRDHKIRHQIAQLIETGSGLFKVIEEWEQSTSVRKINSIYPKFDSILNGILNILDVIPSIYNSINIINNLENFNDLKNQGFYVDFIDRIIIPSESVNEKHYKTALLISNRLSKHYRLLKILFHPSLKYHMDKSKIDELKTMIKSITDNAMKEFSFKELNLPK